MNHATHSCREITETIQKMLNNGEITYKSAKPNPPKVAVMTHYNLLVSPKSNQIMFRVMILLTPQALPQSPPPLVSKMSPLPNSSTIGTRAITSSCEGDGIHNVIKSIKKKISISCVFDA